MTSKDKPTKTFYHQDQESNLLAVKRSLRTHRKAYMSRRTDLSDDVIDVIDDGQIIERHIAKQPQKVVAIVVTRHFCVEDLALYQ